MAYALFMLYPGMPMVYYGEEIFMEGGSDPDNRRGMQWEKTQNPDYHVRLFASLMRLRKENALRFGETVIEEKEGILVVRRVCEGEVYSLYLNTLDHPMEVAESGGEVLSNRAANGTLYEKGFLISKNR